MNIDLKIYDEFRNLFPLERVRSLSLEDYTCAGRKDTFTYWIENELDKWGSIWGGSSFKFGIYNRKDKTECKDNSSSIYTEDYAWYRKYGTNKDDVFKKVRCLIVDVIEASQRGDLDALEKIALGIAYKWKIAFHYQDNENPLIIPIFRLEAMQLYFKSKIKKMSEFHKKIKCSNLEDGYKLSIEIWKKYTELDKSVTAEIIGEAYLGILVSTNEEEVSAEEGKGGTVTIKTKSRSAKLVDEVKKRDKYSCRACGFYYNNKIVHVHHLDPLSEAASPKTTKTSDLITLCPNCHFIAHYLLHIDDNNKNEKNLLNKLRDINTEK